MNKLIRIYNQNRRKIWTIIIAIVVGFILLHLLNQFQAQSNAEKNEQEKSWMKSDEQNESKTYTNESKSMVSGGSVPNELQQKFGSLIDQFLNYCTSREPEKAYGLLSDNCKQVLYPNEKIFEEQYYESKFASPKRYTFQSWTSTDTYIYLVKIFDDMLATGVASTQNYIQDYYSIVKENETYKLNINGYVGRVKHYGKKEQNNVVWEIRSSDIFMDDEIVNLSIQNKTNKTIMIDPLITTDSICLINEKEISYSALLHEKTKEEFMITSGETKQVSLKFANSYQEKVQSERIEFNHIILDYQSYQEKKDDYQEYQKIKIDL